MSYFAERYSRSEYKIKVEINMSHYAEKSDLK